MNRHVDIIPSVPGLWAASVVSRRGFLWGATAMLALTVVPIGTATSAEPRHVVRLVSHDSIVVLRMRDAD